jgi:hypothetical protein
MDDLRPLCVCDVAAAWQPRVVFGRGDIAFLPDHSLLAMTLADPVNLPILPNRLIMQPSFWNALLLERFVTRRSPRWHDQPGCHTF